MIFSLLLTCIAHAVLPVLGAVFTKSKSGVILGGALAAVISVVISFLSATPIFMGASLAGILLGLWVGFALVKNRYRS